MAFSATDKAFMLQALWLARRGRGRTEPNPMVGALWVRDGRVLGAGYHRRVGAPHAEREALGQSDARGGTLYVTLEPCVHQGRTPPCVDRILEKKVERVVACRQDPDPRVNGRGFDRLRREGVQVETGCLEALHADLNRRYLTARRRGTPWVTLKAGVSLDGRLTDAAGRSRWVTPEAMRRMAHSMRGEFSAVMAGAGTARRDDPGLDLRHSDWQDKGHLRVVLAGEQPLPADLQLFCNTERFPTLVCAPGPAPAALPPGVEWRTLPGTAGKVDLEAVLAELGRREIRSLLVEGGPALMTSFLSQGLWDEVTLFCAGTLLGGRDAPGLLSAALGVERPLRFRGQRVIPLPGGFLFRGVA